MRIQKIHIGAIGIFGLAVLAAPPFAQAEQNPGLQAGAVSPSAETLYQGWRASTILDKEAVSNSNQQLGTVRNILVGKDGQIEGLMIEGRGASDRREFVFRIPWQRVDISHFPGKIVANISRGEQPEFGLFPDSTGVPALPSEFGVNQIIGDYARLQTGLAFGYVSDAVFTPSGKMSAILVTREAAGGGGVYSFGFPQITSEKWHAGLSYHGLPYVTTEQAKQAAVEVDVSRFQPKVQ